MALLLAGCGNGENTTQAVVKLLSNARASGESAVQHELQDRSIPTLAGGERYVAFESGEPNLVERDTNRVTDVFVYDRQTKQTTCVSVNSIGAQANGGSFAPEVTRDGRFVVFESLASNLVSGDTNGVIDVFMHDRQTKRTTRVSVVSGGAQANNMSINPSISADGRYVTFESFATNLLPDKADGPKQTFAHDRQTGDTRRAPTDSAHGTVAGTSTPVHLHPEKR